MLKPYADKLSKRAWLALACLLWAGAAQSGSFGTNLVVNGDAEAQPPTGVVLTTFPGWITDGFIGVASYNKGPMGSYPVLPTPTSPIDQGANLFFGYRVNASNQSTAYQDIDLSFAATAINAGTVTYNFSGLLGGYSSQADNAALDLFFYDANRYMLGGQATLGPVTNVDRKNTNGLVLRSASGTVPAGASFARVRMTMTRYEGQDNDGVADNIQLVLNNTVQTSTPTQPTPTQPSPALLSQTISFVSVPDVLTVGGTATFSVTASSGLPVSFSSQTPTVCSVSGSTVAAIAAGTCTIAADQAGNSSYSAAPQRIQFITVTSGTSGGSPSTSGGTTDTYNSANNQLTIPKVVVGSAFGNTTYTNVVITVGSVVSVGAAPAAGTYDTYDGTYLTIPAVVVGNAFGKATYYNVKITVGSVVSVGP